MVREFSEAGQDEVEDGPSQGAVVVFAAHADDVQVLVAAEARLGLDFRMQIRRGNWDRVHTRHLARLRQNFLWHFHWLSPLPQCIVRDDSNSGPIDAREDTAPIDIPDFVIGFALGVGPVEEVGSALEEAPYAVEIAEFGKQAHGEIAGESEFADHAVIFAVIGEMDDEGDEGGPFGYDAGDGVGDGEEG